jgi:hypothetical protein
MIPAALVLLVAICLVGCSVRSVVVPPDQLSALNDSKWTIQSEPSTAR